MNIYVLMFAAAVNRYVVECKESVIQVSSKGSKGWAEKM